MGAIRGGWCAVMWAAMLVMVTPAVGTAQEEDGGDGACEGCEFDGEQYICLLGCPANDPGACSTSGCEPHNEADPPQCSGGTGGCGGVLLDGEVTGRIPFGRFANSGAKVESLGEGIQIVRRDCDGAIVARKFTVALEMEIRRQTDRITI